MPEIIGRETAYVGDGIRLIWLLSPAEADLFSSAYHRDIGFRARSNYFVLDNEAVDASRRLGTVCVKVFWRSGGNFQSRVITLDDLTYPPGGLPFYVDQRTRELLEASEARRLIAANAILESRTKGGFVHLPVLPGIDGSPAQEDVMLIGVGLTVLSEAQGAFTNYVYKTPNLASVLNSYLHSEGGSARAAVIADLIGRLGLNGTLAASTKEKLSKALQTPQVSHDDKGWTVLKWYLMELFDQPFRSEALEGGMLPAWATQSSA